jgi:hypothetical protein
MGREKENQLNRSVHNIEKSIQLHIPLIQSRLVSLRLCSAFSALLCLMYRLFLRLKAASKHTTRPKKLMAPEEGGEETRNKEESA